MKQASTLKLEINGPVGLSWRDIKPRLFALRKTSAQALTLTMQDHHGDAVKELRAYWSGDSKEERKASSEWRRKVEKSLRDNWNMALEREKKFRGMGSEDDRDLLACAPVGEVLTAETVDNILSRFSGQHFKDLIAGRDGLPSFVQGCSFYSRSRACEISGAPDAAEITLPLFGTGKKATRFSLGIGGGSARAQWRKLVADFARRDEVVALEADAKNPALKAKATEKLEKLGLTKMGRVGVTYDERRRKWFATVSYTQHRSDTYKEGQKAALNFGVNVFIQALAEDGAEWHEDGDQIIAKRVEGASIRKRIQRSMRTFGNGSRGRGKARRELPLTKRKGGESRFVETYIRQLSSALIKWCRRQNVSDLYIEDMSGMREQFERATEGRAHAEVKRRIHQWPFYDTARTIEREGAEHGVRVHVKGAHYVSQRCPDCRHIDPENVQEITIPGLPIMHEGKMYRRIEKTTRFECKKCGKRGGSDFIACMNHLIDVGSTFGGKATPLQKAQERAKVAVSSDKRKKVRRSA